MVPIPDPDRTERGSAVASRWLGLFVIAVGFLFAVQLLSGATTALAPQIEATIRTVVTTGTAALGVSWLASYVLLNGSVVAAIAISLFASDLVTAPQLFLMVAGSRLGSAGIVVLVGGFDFLQERRTSFREATALGLLAFVLTISIYLPATALGYVWVGRVPEVGLSGTRVLPLELVTPFTSWVVVSVGPAAAFVLALLLLLSVMRLLDCWLDRVQTDSLQSLSTRMLRHRWWSLALGLVVTALTTSVAFSLGIVVPLYNRDYVSRAEVVPYVLGASIGTLADTLLVAFVLRTPAGVTTVVLLLATASIVTLGALLGYERYSETVAAVHDRLLADPWMYAAFLATLVILPLVLVLLG